jgi:predicted RNase H-like nuclease (RuvC/YqgF family)
VTEKYGGFANAVFRVEAPPDEIPVSARRSGDTRIEIERERKDGIEFESLVRRRDHVVVGMDPGTTTALGVVDLDGEVLETWSSRTVDTAGVVEWIIEHGRPVIVAADVTPMPDTVEKIRRSFDAAAWTPERDLPIDEKQHRTREHGYDNDHQRDALAAALFAHDDHAEQFERIAAKTPPREDRGEITAEVLSTETSVEAVLRERESEDSEPDESEEHSPRELSDEERRIRELEDRVERLEEHNADLKADLDRKDARIEERESELEAARREERRDARERRAVTRLEREVNRLESELEEERERADTLESKLERLKALWKLDHSNFSDVDGEKRDLVPVKVVEQFTNAAIEDAQERYGLAPDDVVYLRDASGAGRTSAEALADAEPRVVLTEHGGLSEVADETLFEAEIPVGPADDVAMQEVDELAVARESDVEAVVADWEERAAERRKERKASMVDELISEHRARGDGD